MVPCRFFVAGGVRCGPSRVSTVADVPCCITVAQPLDCQQQQRCPGGCSVQVVQRFSNCVHAVFVACRLCPCLNEARRFFNQFFWLWPLWYTDGRVGTLIIGEIPEHSDPRHCLRGNPAAGGTRGAHGASFRYFVQIKACCCVAKRDGWVPHSAAFYFTACVVCCGRICWLGMWCIESPFLQGSKINWIIWVAQWPFHIDKASHYKPRYLFQ